MAPAGASSSPIVLGVVEFFSSDQTQIQRDPPNSPSLLPPHRLEENRAPAPLLPSKIPPLAPVDTTAGVFELPVSTTTTFSPAFKISDLEKIEYKADILTTDHSGQAARLTYPDHVDKRRTMVCKSMWVNEFGSFSVAKNLLSDRLSVPPAAVDGKRLVPLYLVDGLRCQKTSPIIDISEIYWAGFDIRVHLQL